MSRINLDEPRWDQSTYAGRARHFFTVTNPMNLFCTSAQLDWSREVVTKYRTGEKLDLSDDEIWKAKHMYDSAFHPDTGEKMLIIGRMSAQVPMNMSITGCMMTFYQTTPQVVFWQWMNQSFNALVNYTNRAGDSPISQNTLVTSYLAATGGALGTALSLNAMVKSLPPLVGRLVPFVAVSAANAINIPMMRRSELEQGVPCFTPTGEKVGLSPNAAREGITKVALSRVCMAAPGMVIIPLIMNSLEKRGILARYPRINAPLQIGLCGIILTFATPLCCAIFEQRASIHVDKLEPELKDKLRALKSSTEYVYYNKGL
ncbi:hypothetical protein TCAL_07904 [Tigriopus californicus]|uniref:Sidoreflexin n=1 Tax=Tigriopus californicus TaxID=6832 RepID=A0A553P703_TIGCA|nr:sideroflexin-3-like [Tigriopus californicus]XP_059080497.1 sideroflexin-3-like [Tigriopus californicus]XP_059080499.1 sideroflexin-3-like [Tigriopus californicus]XP_059080500.1 sideroflexin-3-like [Tigriopus californicus]TRY73455.1 hypothetical protein TCAL_07904 [Tigriopus californicus]